MELRHIIASHLRLLHKRACPWSSDKRPSRQWLGHYGELVTCSWLRSKKIKILRTNFRWGHNGEIDIVAREGNTLLFIEVKTRRNTDFGNPSLNVNIGKRKLLRKAAKKWLSLLGEPYPPYRFDIIEILLPAKQIPQLEHLKNCFPLEEEKRGLFSSNECNFT